MDTLINHDSLAQGCKTISVLLRGF
ncbi:hypothetical protein ACT691_02055 [Vibrio metschnikovii]